MKKTVAFVALAALTLVACGLKVPTTIVAGSETDGGLSGNDTTTNVDVGPGQQDAADLPGADTGTDIDTGQGDEVVDGVESIFNSETEGITKDKITVCAHVPISGAAPIPHHENRFGQFYFDYVNQELGGVYGRKVTFRAIDDRYFPAGARDAMEQCKRQGAYIYFGAAGTDQIVSVANWAQTNRVPYFHGPTSIADMGNLDYNVHVGPTYENQHKLLAQYLVKRFGKDTVFGSVRVDSKFFEAGVKAFRDELRRLGAQHVVELKVQKDESQFRSVLFELENKGVEVVNNFTTPNIWIRMLAQAATYQPWWTAVSPVAGFNIVAAALPSNAKSVIFHHFQPGCDCQTYKDEEISQKKHLPWYDDIQEFLRVFKKYSPEQDPPPDDFDYSSFLSARGIHRLLLKVGPDPTRAKLWDLVFSYKENPNKTFPGCAGDFTRTDDRIGAWRVNVMELTGNKTWKQIDTCIDRV